MRRPAGKICDGESSRRRLDRRKLHGARSAVLGVLAGCEATGGAGIGERIPKGRFSALPRYDRATCDSLLRQHLPVFFEYAAVHDHLKARLPSLRRRFLVHHAFLHPDAARANADGRVNNLGHRLGPPEDVDDVDPLRHIIQRCPGFLAQDFSFVRVHRDNAISRDCIYSETP